VLEDILRSYNGYEVSAMDVYSDIFHLGDGEIQRCSKESGDMKANPIGYWKQDSSDKGHFRILFEDTFEEVLKELQEADFSILNGFTYFGRRNVQQRASKCYALIFDLDGVTDVTLNRFLHAAVDGNDYDIYPLPNYIALSGHGIHLYYVFEEPVPLYPNIKTQLKAFKYALTDKIWNQYTSTEENKQFQTINQGFRVIGGKTKVPGVRVRAFRMNSHPFSLTDLGRFIPEKDRVDETKIWKEAKLTLQEAKKKYPEWYQSRIVEKKEKGHWICKRDLYDWWIRKIKEGAVFGHRYYCIMCLTIYAVKCGIDIEEVKRDSLDLIPFMNMIAPDHDFKELDVLSALECYDKGYYNFTIDDIVKLSGIQIEKNKRNGRKRADHIKRVNATRIFERDVLNENPYQNNGRPLKKDQVANWIRSHPEGTVSQCAKDLQISRTTVYKYWNV
jgi:hypothetical protein